MICAFWKWQNPMAKNGKNKVVGFTSNENHFQYVHSIHWAMAPQVLSFGEIPGDYTFETPGVHE
jgi:hypothetical protein